MAAVSMAFLLQEGKTGSGIVATSLSTYMEAPFMRHLGFATSIVAIFIVLPAAIIAAAQTGQLRGHVVFEQAAGTISWPRFCQ